MSDDEPLEMEKAYHYFNNLGKPPEAVKPMLIGDRVSMLDHELESIRRMVPDEHDQEFVWECQRCNARAEDLGAIPVVCDD